MLKRTVSLAVLFLLLTNVFVFSFAIRSVKAAGTVYIRADGSIDPPTAPISTLDNVTYTLTGNITGDADGIVVERDNIVVEGASFWLEGMGTISSSGIYLYGRNNVTIQNINIKHFYLNINLVSSSNNNINGNTLTDSAQDGIYLIQSSNNNLNENNITNNISAIEVSFCSNNNISGNTITDNDDGIAVSVSSNNRISGNTITNSDVGGIYVGFSSNNSISANTIAYTIMYGIALSEQEYCSVSGNTITNSDVGITLDAISDYNSINGNTMANNSVGIGVAQASNNTFCHNNLVNNTQQAEFERPLEYTNFWDNGCEGNYWSDYTGTDLDNDGVGDTYLPWETVDNYPLMNIYWNPCDINHDLKVDMRDIGLSAKAFGTSPGDMLWNPHADITSREPNVPDAKVDMRDISLIAIHFGERYP